MALRRRVIRPRDYDARIWCWRELEEGIPNYAFKVKVHIEDVAQDPDVMCEAFLAIKMNLPHYRPADVDDKLVCSWVIDVANKYNRDAMCAVSIEYDKMYIFVRFEPRL
jgi:hypothetical protein